ncbi:BT_3928 family protein [Schleiferia thermophila]|uniref:BT_3928 family protein n=1 Tax=Schleiferia thermophila TaxID=884107 RepID=UPI003EEE10A8
MKPLVTTARILVGALFIFSGLVKLNDPMGFGFKLEDYFAADVLNLPFLTPYALGLAIFIVTIEIVLGVMLLIGLKVRFTLYALLAMIVFFTFLTFYSAYYNKVTDCGCFGDAIPLTPWQSFTKDVILLVLIVFLIVYRHLIQPIASSAVLISITAASALISLFTARHVLRHLPFIDFRPYAVGKSIVEGMKTAEELGLESPKYLTFYTLRHSESGKIVEVNSDDYIAERWWEKEDWEIVTDKTRSVKVKDGYEPPIHDFKLMLGDMDITDEVLSADKVLLVVMYDINKSDLRNYDRINDLVQFAESKGAKVLGLTGSSSSDYEPIRHEVQAAFPWAICDMTTLKTMVRSNPGLMVLERGTVKAMFSHWDTPSPQKAENMGLF